MRTITRFAKVAALFLLVPFIGLAQQNNAESSDLAPDVKKARMQVNAGDYDGKAQIGTMVLQDLGLLQPNAYCTASAVCDEYISNVTVGTINNTTMCTSGGYHDYTSISTTMTVGQSYPISVSNGNAYTGDQCGIWVDWNQNENFTDDAPITVVGTPGGGPYTATITPPTGAAPGSTRMRVRIMFTGTLSPCGATDYGETEDYTIVIPGGATTDVGVVSTTLPSVAGPGTITPEATVRNFGSVVQTFTVTLTIGTYTSTQTVTALAPYTNSTVTFAPWTAAIGNYNAVINTTLTGDVNTSNDTLTKAIAIQALQQVYAYNAYDPSSTLVEGPVKFSIQTPGNITLLAATTSNDFLSAGTWANNTWYGAEYSASNAGLLYTINTTTGALTTIGNTNQSLTGLAYDPVTAIMYGANATSLYTVNLTTGATTLVGSFGLTGTMIALAYKVNGGVLYGINLDDNLYVINKATGAATLVGPLGININYAQDAEFDNNNGILYLAGYTTTGGLYTVNTTTGTATLVGAFTGGAEITCFAIPYTYTAPGVDVGVSSIIKPNSGYSLTSDTVKVVVNNYGTTAQSNIPVSYKINNGTPVTQTIAASIAPGANYTHSFTTLANLSTPGSYVIKAYTGLSTDANPLNDTATKTVQHLTPSTIPFLENWTSGVFTTNAWSFDATQGNWTISSTAGNPTPSVQFGWSPQITNYSHSMVSTLLSPGSATSVTLKYDLMLADYGNTGLEKMDVDVWNGTTWTTLATYTNIADIAWTTYTHNITTSAIPGPFKVRFRAYGADSYEIDYWYIDNIQIYQQTLATLSGTVTALAGGAPIAGAVVTATGATTLSATTTATGTYTISLDAGTYNVTCAAPGYNQGSATGVVVSGATTQNFALTAPVMAVTPTSVTTSMSPFQQPSTHTVTINNTGNGPLNWNANVLSKGEASKAMWDLQFVINADSITGGVGLAGAEFDGVNFWAAEWGSSGNKKIFKVSPAGALLSTVTTTWLPGTSGLRDLAFDGTYLYGSPANTTLYCFDLNGNLVNTTTSPVAIRAIAYDEVNDAFWVNNFATDLTLVSRTGAVLNVIATPPSCYGAAYDNVSPGGPFLWIFSGTTSGAGCQIQQYNLNTGVLTAVTHSVSGDLGATAIAGGLFSHPNIIPGTYTVGGIAQGPQDIFGYEVATVSNWLSANPLSGTIPAGGNGTITLTINPSGIAPGTIKTGKLLVTPTPNVGVDTVNITLDVIVGREEIISNGLRIFPNPATDMVYIQADNEIRMVRMINYAGQVISESLVRANETSINTSALRSGIYFLQIETAQGMMIERITVR